jgi:hypothetical protein
MPVAKKVRPKKWQEITVLFDDGRYSVISGRYEVEKQKDHEHFVLGERWNGTKDHPLGFPNGAGYPIWHVAPDFLAIPILEGLLTEIADPNKKSYGNPEKIRLELKRQQKIRSN